jgi:nuclear pore complex protein Nup93
LSKEVGEDGYHVDAVHISIALADHGVLPDGVGSEQKMGVMDACAESAGIIQHYGSIYLCNGNIDLALAYYAQAAAAMGGGEVAWIGEGNSDQQRQQNLMLKQLLTEILLRDGGIQLLLGSSGMGEEGELKKYMMDWRSRQQFLLEAAHRCQEVGLYDKVSFQNFVCSCASEIVLILHLHFIKRFQKGSAPCKILMFVLYVLNHILD